MMDTLPKTSVEIRTPGPFNVDELQWDELTIPNFRAFLLTNKERKFEKGDAFRCPLTLWISEMFNAYRVSVGAEYVYVNGTSRKHFPWMAQFIGEYDFSERTAFECLERVENAFKAVNQ